MGRLTFFLSGSNAQLNSPIPIKYRSKGISMQYKNTGGLDYSSIAKSISYKLYKEAKALPIDNYDLIINDFEFITSLSCSLKRKKVSNLGTKQVFRVN